VTKKIKLNTTYGLALGDKELIEDQLLKISPNEPISMLRSIEKKLASLKLKKLVELDIGRMSKTGILCYVQRLRDAMMELERPRMWKGQCCIPNQNDCDCRLDGKLQPGSVENMEATSIEYPPTRATLDIRGHIGGKNIRFCPRGVVTSYWMISEFGLENKYNVPNQMRLLKRFSATELVNFARALEIMVDNSCSIRIPKPTVSDAYGNILVIDNISNPKIAELQAKISRLDLGLQQKNVTMPSPWQIMLSSPHLVQDRIIVHIPPQLNHLRPRTQQRIAQDIHLDYIIEVIPILTVLSGSMISLDWIVNSAEPCN
jgi:hypothetical protein